MYTPKRIAGRKTVIEFLPEKLRVSDYIYRCLSVFHLKIPELCSLQPNNKPEKTHNFHRRQNCIVYHIIIIIIRLLRIKAAQNTLQNIKRSNSNKREEIKTNTTMKETNVQN